MKQFFTRRYLLYTIMGSLLFSLGFTVSRWTQTSPGVQIPGRVTGIGGIFFKCKDPKAVREWYRQNLGIQTNEYGAVFEFRQGVDSSKKGFLQWSPFNEKTKYFEPSNREFMINYRVVDIEDLVAQLRQNGVTITDSIETYDYGKFVHILDLEGNKIELWEPNDVAFEDLGRQLGAMTTK